MGSNRFPSSLRFYSYFFHPKRTKFHQISITFLFFRFKSILFLMFHHQFCFIFRYVYLFSAPKRGVQSMPRVVARLLAFFSSQTDKFSLNFDNFFDFFDVLFSAHQIRRGPRTDRPRAHGPTSSWAHELGSRDRGLGVHRPVLKKRYRGPLQQSCLGNDTIKKHFARSVEWNPLNWGAFGDSETSLCSK